MISLFKEQIQQLVHTKDGAHAACLLLSYGTAKDRKPMIKSLREIIPQMSKDQYGHMVIIILCAVVDDTKLVSKAVLTELKHSWNDLIRDKWGRKIILFLCREDKEILVKECREKSVNTRYASLFFAGVDLKVRRIFRFDGRSCWILLLRIYLGLLLLKQVT